METGITKDDGRELREYTRHLTDSAHREAFSYAWNRINTSTPHGTRDGDYLTEKKNLGYTLHGAWLILGQEYPPNNVRYVVPVHIIYSVSRKTVCSVETWPAVTPEDWEKAQHVKA